VCIVALRVFHLKERWCKDMQQVQVSTTPTVLTIAQVAKELCLSRAKVYQLIYHEGLPTVRFGRALRVRHVALLEWLERREEVE
jgi:excisionase family DNA binding protein